MSQGYYSCLVSIQSDHASFGVNNNFTLTLPTAINNAFSFRVLNAQMPLTYYIWTSGVTFQFTTDVTGLVNVTIPPGSYSASAISALIEAQFLAVTGDVVTTTFDLNTFIFYLAITPGTNNTVEVSAANLLAAGTGLGYLGFTVPTGPAAQINGDIAYNFNQPLKLYISCPELAPYQTLQSSPSKKSLSRSSCIRTIHAYMTTGGFVDVDKPTDWYSFSDGYQLSRLTFQVLDENGELVDLHGYRWAIDLEVRFSKLV